MASLRFGFIGYKYLALGTKLLFQGCLSTNVISFAELAFHFFLIHLCNVERV